MRLSDVKGSLEDVSAGGLRERLDMLEKLRDRAVSLTADEYDYLSARLMPYTDAVLHELAKREQGADYVPYPHPVGEAPMDHV